MNIFHFLQEKKQKKTHIIRRGWHGHLQLASGVITATR
jgi:hypothetical protein